MSQKRLTRTFTDRYEELVAAYADARKLTPPYWVSVQGTERSMRNDVSGTITARVENGTVAVLEEPKIVGYTRSKDGKETSYHLKDVANTIKASNHSRTGNQAQYVAEPQQRETTRELVMEGRLRLRKLTPRECFHLMDVSEADIDRIQAAGISKTQQYKMAGNSIVVSCLYEIFKAMFVEPVKGGARQLELF